MTNRTAREDQALAHIDRLGVNIRQARAINRSILIVVAIIAALLIGFNLPNPAHAAKRVTYKGTVTIVYGQGVNDYYSLGAKYTPTRWDVAKAAKAAKIGKYRLVKANTQTQVDNAGGDVFLFTSPDALANGRYYPGRPYATAVIKDCWKGRCSIIDSEVGMSDKVAAKATAAQRQAWLTAAIKAAVPR